MRDDDSAIRRVGKQPNALGGTTGPIETAGFSSPDGMNTVAVQIHPHFDRFRSAPRLNLAKRRDRNLSDPMSVLNPNTDATPTVGHFVASSVVSIVTQ
jgi:hypothetical protein